MACLDHQLVRKAGYSRPGERGVDVLENLAIFTDAHNTGEAFFQGRGLELGGHLPHYVFGNPAGPATIAFKTSRKRHIEKQRLDGTVTTLRDLDEVAALFSDEISRINVSDGTIQVKPDFQ